MSVSGPLQARNAFEVLGFVIVVCVTSAFYLIYLCLFSCKSSVSNFLLSIGANLPRGACLSWGIRMGCCSKLIPSLWIPCSVSMFLISACTPLPGFNNVSSFLTTGFNGTQECLFV